MLVKRCTQNTSKHGQLSSIDRTGKFQFIPVTKKGNTKECSNCHTIALFSHDSKVMLKILQARPQQYVSQELPNVHVGFIKGRGNGDKIANIHWIIEKTREFKKIIYFCSTDYAKVFNCVYHSKLENS